MDYVKARYSVRLIQTLDNINFRDVSAHRSLRQTGGHLRHGPARADSLHLDPPVGQVPDPAGHPEPPGGPLDKAAVANALDLPLDQEPSTGHFPAPALRARRPSTRTGRTEMPMIAMITAVKLSRTTGMLPKR